MASVMVIIKRDGSRTTPMAQLQAQRYLAKLVHANRQSNVKQSLNQAFNGQGKATGDYAFNGFPILHASSGNGQQSVSLFYYEASEILYAVAMGEHRTSTSYRLSDYGQPSGQFAENAVISLGG